MVRFTVLILFLYCSTWAALAQSNCDKLLLSKDEIISAVQTEYSELLKDSNGLKKVYLKLKSKSLQEKIVKLCADKANCTPELVAHLVKETIENTPGLQNALGYGFVMGGMALNAALIAEVTIQFNPQVQFVPTFVGSLLAQMSFVSVNVLAPYLEPLSSRLRRSTFELTKGKSSSKLKPVAPSQELEPLADTINVTYTLREQHVTDRILTFRNALRLNFLSAAEALEKGETHIAAAEIADALMLGYRHFRDLSPADPTIMSAVQSTLRVRFSNVSTLSGLVIQHLQKVDANFKAKPARTDEISASEYYQIALRKWLVDL